MHFVVAGFVEVVRVLSTAFAAPVDDVREARLRMVVTVALSRELNDLVHGFAQCSDELRAAMPSEPSGWLLMETYRRG